MRGFTLVELLVVLVIVGILLSVARLNLTAAMPRQLQQQAAKLQAWMLQQCDTGTLRQTVTIFAVRGQKLEVFEQRAKKNNLKKLDNATFSLPQPMRFQVQQAEKIVPLATRGWRCWPEGAWTPGRVDVEGPGGEKVTLEWDGFGRFQMQGAP